MDILRAKYLYLLAPITLFFINIVLLRVLIFGTGLPIFGDFFPYSQAYLNHIGQSWNPYEQFGQPNYLYAQFPLTYLYVSISKLTGYEFFSRIFVFGSILSLTLFGYFFFLSSSKGNITGSFIGAILIAINPWTLSRLASGHISLIYALSLLPLLLITIMQGNAAGFRDVIKSTLLLSLILMISTHAFVISVVTSAIYLFFSHILQKILIPQVKQTIYKFTLVISLSIILNIFWILPMFSMDALGGIDLKQIIFETNNLSFHANILNVMLFKGYWWLPFSKGIYETGYNIINILFLFSSFAVLTLVLTRTITNEEERGKKIPFYILFLSGIILATGTTYLNKFYISVISIPGLALFRDPDKFLFIGLLGFAALGTMAFPDITRIKIREVYIIILFLFCVAFANWPWISGNLNGLISLSQVPVEYSETEKWLNISTDENAYVFWFPNFTYAEFTWSKGLISDPVRSLSKIPSFNPPPGSGYDGAINTSLFINTVTDYVYNNRGSRLGTLLAQYNVQYIIARTDVLPLDISYKLFFNLGKQVDLQEVYQTGNIHVFKNKSYIKPTSKIREIDTIKLLYGGFRDIALLSYFESLTQTGLLTNKPILEIQEKSVMLDEIILPLINYDDFIIINTFASSSILASSVIESHGPAEDDWVESSWIASQTGDNITKAALTYSTESIFVPFEINMEDDYLIFVQLLGDTPSFVVTVDNENPIKSYNDPQPAKRFRWVSYKTSLDSGQHSLRIGHINDGRPVAVNRILIVKQTDFDKAKRTANSLLAGYNYSILIEGEDFFSIEGNNSYIINNEGDYSQGQSIYVQGRIVTPKETLLHIPKDGVYYMSIIGPKEDECKQNTTIEFLSNADNDAIFELTNPCAESKYALDAGDYQLAITAKNLHIDAIRFKNHTKQKQSEQRQGTYLLVQSFHSSWLMKQSNTIIAPVLANLIMPIYFAGSNSYSSTSEGIIHAPTFVFAPQRWFYLGLLISGTTFLGCIGYLVYDFIRRCRSKITLLDSNNTSS